MRFDDLADDYLTDYRVNGKRVDDAERYVEKHLRPVFGGMRVVDITRDRVKDYMAERMRWTCNDCGERFDAEPQCFSCGSNALKQGAANATINRELSALKRMLNLGAQQTPPKVDRTRMPHIPMLEEDNVRLGFFEHDEFLVLCDALPEHLQVPITFAYKIGWRLSEVCALKYTQVDLKQGIVRLEPRTTKNKKGPTIYLDDEVLGMFRKLWNSKKRLKSGLPWVFLNEYGTDQGKAIRQGLEMCLQKGWYQW